MDLGIFNCRAQWITMADDDTASPLFRKEFETTKAASKVICKISGLGSYIISIDGKRIGDSILEPRFSNYSKSVYYNTIELPPLGVGRHAVGVTLGRSRRSMITKNTWGWHNPPWDTTRQLVVQIDIYYDNGTFACIRSDDTWKYTYGPVRFDCLYSGEKYDAKHEANG
jgi:alpha-L-rhamnosidase